MTRSEPGFVGRSLRRQEDPRLLKGYGAYVSDITRPGLLHMAMVRSPHAHARIRSIDAKAAHELAGVVAVLTAADLDKIGPLPVLTSPPGQRHSGFSVLPADKVLYVGHAVAAVVAESRYVAQDALDARALVGHHPVRSGDHDSVGSVPDERPESLLVAPQVVGEHLLVCRLLTQEAVVATQQA